MLAPGADAACLKRVFNQFCLGGPLNPLELSAELLEPATQDKPQRWEIDGKQIEIRVRNQRIVRVERLEPPGSWINFVDWRRKLTRLYGRGEDLGSMPSYASSRSARLNVIRTGKGKAQMQWQQAGWKVTIIWDHLDYLRLIYDTDDAAADPTTRPDNEGL